MAAIPGTPNVKARGKSGADDKAQLIGSNSCFQDLVNQTFNATGVDAMRAQTDIIKYHIKMSTARILAGYGLSGFLALSSAIIVVFAPEFRSTSANLFAGAFLVLAVGAAGFTRFSTKAPGLEISAD